MKKGIVIRILVLVVIVGLILGAWQLGYLKMLTDFDQVQKLILGFGPWGFLVYGLIYIACCVLFIPGSAVTIVAGLVFGPVRGGITALLSATIGATVAFLIGRYLARDAIVNKFGNNPFFKKIDDGVKVNGISFLILTRLVPAFPFSIQNYAYGLTGIKVSTFFIVSLITMAPGAFIYAYIAGEVATNGFSVSLLLKFAAAGVILFLVSLIPKYIARKKGIDLNELKENSDKDKEESQEV